MIKMLIKASLEQVTRSGKFAGWGDEQIKICLERAEDIFILFDKHGLTESEKKACRVNFDKYIFSCFWENLRKIEALLNNETDKKNWMDLTSKIKYLKLGRGDPNDFLDEIATLERGLTLDESNKRAIREEHRRMKKYLQTGNFL